MRLRPKNLSESLLPLTTVYAIIGYGAFEFPPPRRHPRFSLFYTVISSLIVYTGVGLTVQYSVNEESEGDDIIPTYGIFVIGVLEAIFSQIYSWLNDKRLANVLKQMMNIDETLQELGATFDYTGTMNLGIRKLVWWLLIIFALDAADISWIASMVSLKELLFIIPILHYPIHSNSFITVYFSMLAGNLELRFRKVNEVLENISNPFRQPINNRRLRFVGNKMNSRTFTISTRQILKGAERRKNVIQVIKHVHLMLSILSRDINRAFGVQLLLEMISCFITFVFLVPRIYMLATDPPDDIDTYQQCLQIIVPVCWCVAYMLKLIVVNQVCEAASAEAYRTGNIIHGMEDMNDDPEFSTEVQQFSFQIKQNRLVFSPTGLITLGWTFVQSFVSTIMLYLVFIVQAVEDSYVDDDYESYDDYEESTSSP